MYHIKESSGIVSQVPKYFLASFQILTSNTYSMPWLVLNVFCTLSYDFISDAGRGSSLDIPGALLPTSIPPPATCKSQNMTIYLKPGQVYADVQPTSDINLRLSAGSHVYKDKSKDCTVNIQVLEPGELIAEKVLLQTGRGRLTTHHIQKNW